MRKAGAFVGRSSCISLSGESAEVPTLSRITWRALRGVAAAAAAAVAAGDGLVAATRKPSRKLLIALRGVAAPAAAAVLTAAAPAAAADLAVAAAAAVDEVEENGTVAVLDVAVLPDIAQAQERLAVPVAFGSPTTDVAG